jgi:translation initiation factor 1
MSKKNKPDDRGFVYSTDPGFQFHGDEQVQETLPPGQQKLRVRLETKHRAGKMVTVISGFIGTVQNAEQLCKQLKNLCGTGGTYKEGEIIIQGDHRVKVVQYLQKSGYTNTK